MDNKFDLKPYARKTRIFDPSSSAPFKISRSKIDLFVDCPLCFWLDLTKGVSRTSLPGFTLNIAVDHLLKKEFDIHRSKGEAHPLMKKYGIDAIPYTHPEMENWRNNFVGVQTLHRPTNLTVFGAVDDIWIGSGGDLHVVDYKATSKAEKPNLDGYWQQAYKRQMEVYQWLLRQNEFDVSDTGYFVYVNGKKDKEAFDAKLEFDVDIIAYEGNSDWVENKLEDAKKVLMSDSPPSAGERCEHCRYRAAVKEVI